MSNQTTKLRAAVIGLGWPGIQHLKGYIADPRSEVVAVCDLDRGHAKKVASEYKISRVYTDHLKMLDNADVDAVSVCLPNFLHAPISIDALNAGISMCFVRNRLLGVLRKRKQWLIQPLKTARL